MSIAVALLLASCSKEAQIKKQLSRNWTVTKVVTVTTINSETPTTDTNTSETETVFDKAGTGTSSSSGSGSSPFPGDFTWSNTDATVTIVDTQDNSFFVYDVVEHSKKQMVLNVVIHQTIGSDNYKVDITITLDKV